MPDDPTIRDENLTLKIQWVESAEEATFDARTAAERDRDYYDNIQWTEAEKQALQQRGQAPIVINRIKPKVDFLRGVERRLRTDPKAFPRTPQHEDDAHSATDAIRFVCDNNDWDSIRSRVWDNLVIEGMGGCDVTVEPTPDGRFEIVIDYIAWDRIGYDPYSSEPDFSDARYKFIVIWMDEEEALDRWPEGREAIEGALANATTADTYDDKPKFTVWADARRKRVRVVQMHYRRGEEWWICTFTKGGFLEDPQPSPYLDEFGVPESGLLLTSAYMDRDNNRYGYVRPMIWPQDEVNKRRSKSLHLLNSKTIISDGSIRLGDGAKPDRNRIKAEAARPDAYFEVEGNGRFEMIDGVELASAQLALLQEAKGEIDALGPNTALQGRVEGESGRAIQAKQQGGFIEMEPLTDGQRKWARAVYRKVWNCIRQFWREERWIRVTDDENNLRWVVTNGTLGTQLSQIEDPNEQAAALQQLGIFPGDPRLGQVVSNNLAELDVDISLDDGPDIITLRDEQFDTLASMFKDGILPPEMVDLLVEASDLRNKDGILERLRGTEEQAQQQQIEQETMKTLQISGAAAEVDKLRAEAAKIEAGVGAEQARATEDMADARDALMDAEIKRQKIARGLIA